ncbi:hypothetical protein B0H19DRAFT_1333099 [Mycena capillaripes]|nr:hypothetical protein B0H19DRAFT_1333099 [Mycena capillaripes]
MPPRWALFIVHHTQQVSGSDSCVTLSPTCKLSLKCFLLLSTSPLLSFRVIYKRARHKQEIRDAGGARAELQAAGTGGPGWSASNLERARGYIKLGFETQNYDRKEFLNSPEHMPALQKESLALGKRSASGFPAKIRTVYNVTIYVHKELPCRGLDLAQSAVRSYPKPVILITPSKVEDAAPVPYPPTAITARIERDGSSDAPTRYQDPATSPTLSAQAAHQCHHVETVRKCSCANKLSLDGTGKRKIVRRPHLSMDQCLRAWRSDPCTVASASQWVSSKAAHACELNIPFNKTRSLAVIDSNIKALQWYSLENWFLHSPNPLIPQDVDIASLLQAVQQKTAASGYKTDWDFNLAVTDAWNREADGHTLFAAACTEAFSYNLPFSIATLASTPTSPVTYPTFLVNYDFPNQVRPGLEAYFESLNVHIRPYDGAPILAIDGVDASRYLVALATESSIYKGLVATYETVNPRYMRLMSRYSADTVSGGYTQEVGSFSQRTFYPCTDALTVLLETSEGPKTLNVPWAATFVGSGNATASFIAETCSVPAANSVESKRSVEAGADILLQKGVVRPGSLGSIRTSPSWARLTAQTNYVQSNLTSFGHITTLDIYQLAAHPHLKAAGVKHVLIDTSGNRGGIIRAGAVAMWSLFPQDLYPGLPAVFRDGELIRQQSVAAAAGAGGECFYGFYRDVRLSAISLIFSRFPFRTGTAQLNYTTLTSNTQFMDPPVPQIINGIADAFSHPFFDNSGTAADTTNFTAPPFSDLDLVIVANSVCASTCSIFSSYLYEKHGVRSAVFGGTPAATASDSQFDGGVKGSEVTFFESVLLELRLTGLADAPSAPRAFPINTELSMNFRNANQDEILDYVWEEGTRKYQFTLGAKDDTCGFCICQTHVVHM